MKRLRPNRPDQSPPTFPAKARSRSRPGAKANERRGRRRLYRQPIDRRTEARAIHHGDQTGESNGGKVEKRSGSGKMGETEMEYGKHGTKIPSHRGQTPIAGRGTDSRTDPLPIDDEFRAKRQLTLDRLK